jgi:hypothetical protein
VLDAAGDGDAAGREVEEACWGHGGLVLVLVLAGAGAGGGVGEGPVEDGCVEGFGCGVWVGGVRGGCVGGGGGGGDDDDDDDDGRGRRVIVPRETSLAAMPSQTGAPSLGGVQSAMLGYWWEGDGYVDGYSFSLVTGASR